MIKNTFGLLLTLGFLCLLHTAFAQVEKKSVLKYRTFGDKNKQAIMLLSDGPGMASNYMDVVATSLSEQGFYCIVVDQRGCGESTSYQQKDINLDAYIQDLMQVRTQLKISKPIMLGHGFGAKLAMVYAGKHPNNCKALMLIGAHGINPYFFQTYGRSLAASLSKEDKLALGNITEKAEQAKMAQVLASRYLFDKSLAAKLHKEVFSTSLENREVTGLMVSHFRENKIELAETIKRYQGPVLLIQGCQDAVGKASTTEIEALYKDVQLEWISACGHYPWIEKKSDFYDELFSFAKKL